jgi:hypothetical protein
VSGIAAVGQSSSDYYLWLMQVSLQGSQSVTTPTGVDGSQPTTSTAQSGAPGSTGSSASSLEDAIRTAVLNAIQEAEKSGNTSDLKTVIQNAVEQALKAAGIDPQTLQQQAEGQGTQGAHHRHHHHHQGQAGGVDQGNGTGSTAGSEPTSSQPTDSQTGVTGQTNGADNTTGSQQTSSQQISELLMQILQVSGSSSGNQAVSGFLLDMKL